MKQLNLLLQRTPPTMALAAGITLLSGLAAADDWPQWRGPTRDGISKETGLLREWPAAGPALRWQVNGTGAGYSTPAVVEDRLFLLGNEGLDNEFVQALAAGDGHRVWRTRIGKVGNPDQKPNYPGARSTPTIDGDHAYALGSDGDLVCLEAGSGKLVWRKNLRADFGGKPGIWAYAESPLIDGGTLVCTPGGSEATLVALDKDTGAVLWKCAVPGGDEATYPSVIQTEIGGVKQYVQFLKQGLVGVNARTGETLWRYGETADLRSGGSIMTPVAYRGQVYSAAGLVGGGLARVQAGADGRYRAETVYFSKKLPIGIGGVVRLGDYLYGASGQSLQCVGFGSGEVKWEDRSIGAASVAYADGCLYLRGENGEVALVDGSPEGYREKGRFRPANQPDRGSSKAWSYPVIASGRLYLQDLDTVWCYDIAR